MVETKLSTINTQLLMSNDVLFCTNCQHSPKYCQRLMQNEVETEVGLILESGHIQRLLNDKRRVSERRGPYLRTEVQ